MLALALVYFVMAALFESLIHPFAIMFALPFAFVGISWMCFLLTSSPFNLMAQIGLLDPGSASSSTTASCSFCSTSCAEQRRAPRGLLDARATGCRPI